MTLTTWRELISESLEANNEKWKDVLFCTLSEAELDVEFDDGYGGHEGAPFTLWTANRVYFPAVYDGAEWAASVVRNPCNYKTPHVGGG